MPIKIITDESMMELLQHGSEAFPFEYYYDEIEKYDSAFIAHHWHNEFEFLSVERGTALCHIGDLEIILQEGEGAFINTGVIHAFETPDQGIMPNILFTAEFLASDKSRIYDKFVQPFLDSNISHIVLKKGVPWQKEVLSLLVQVYELYREREYTWELDLHTLICKIWSLLLKHKGELVTIEKTGTTPLSQGRLKRMTRFIEQNYSEKIKLQQIADAASISKSEALRCFKKGMHTSPVDYLNRYRLGKARTLLLNTTGTVTDIAEKVGFDSTSYFDRMYKREYGLTPKEQRTFV